MVRERLWTITVTGPDGPWTAGAVRPGVQWIDLPYGQVLVRDDVAHVRGAMFLLGLVGHGRDPVRLDDVVAGRWVTCPAASWLGRANDHSALGLFGDSLLDEPDEPVTPFRAERVGGHVTVWLTSSDTDRVLLLAPVGAEARLVRTLGNPRPMAWDFDDAPLPLPDVAADGVLPLPDLLRLLGSTRRRPRRTATVEVAEPDEPGEQWSLHSDDLAAALGVEAGYEAEALALQLLAERVPHLVHLVEGDSYDTVFSAYVPDRETAEAVAAVLRRPHG